VLVVVEEELVVLFVVLVEEELHGLNESIHRNEDY
jgi:hypothetical protein